MRVHWGRCNLPVGAKKLGTHHCIKEQKSALKSMFFPNGPDDELQIIGFLWMENKESCLFLHIGCESKICSSPCEVPDLSKQWNPGQLTCRLKAASPERARFCVCSLSTPIRNRRCAMERWRWTARARSRALTRSRRTLRPPSQSGIGRPSRWVASLLPLKRTMISQSSTSETAQIKLMPRRKPAIDWLHFPLPLTLLERGLTRGQYAVLDRHQELTPCSSTLSSKGRKPSSKRSALHFFLRITRKENFKIPALIEKISLKTGSEHSGNAPIECER